MSERLPLNALLGQALVAFTIELDNEWEARMPHHTTDFGGNGRAWAISLRQWLNMLRHVPAGGITAAELRRVARAEPALHAMQRWGYVKLGPDGLIRPTKVGRRAQEVSAPLPEEIEGRWRERLGAEVVDGLRARLEPAAERVGEGLPDWLTTDPNGFATRPHADGGSGPRPRSLATLLSLVLHRFALGYEKQATASLGFTANVLRLLEAPLAVAELPRRSGVAAPALGTALGILGRQGFVEVGSGRGRVARLTARGEAERELYARRTAELEESWLARGGDPEVRSGLETVLAGAVWPQIDPPSASWRARLARPAELPHHPHPRQGGHPDGV